MNSQGLEIEFLSLGGTKATGHSNKKAPRSTSGKNALTVDNGLRGGALRPNPERRQATTSMACV